MNHHNQYHLPLIYNVLILLFAMLLCGYFALLWGKDLDWDLANYHFSNAYLFLHHHSNQDFWPPSYMHRQFSPTADFFTYFMITRFSSIQAVFFTGAIHGINLWLLFQINRLFLPCRFFSTGIALALALIGMFGVIGYFAIGNFKNDELTAIFVLTFIFYQLKSIKYIAQQGFISLRLSLITGLFLGIAVGLKLTTAVYVIAAFAANVCLSVSWLNRFKLTFLLGCGCLLGYLIANGYWALFLWQQFHNPFYPFLSHLFHTTAIPENSWHFMDYASLSFWDKIIYPIAFSFYGTFEAPFRDLRYFFVYILLIVTGITTLLKIFQAQKPVTDLSKHWLYLFFIFTYFFFQMNMGTIRYLLIIEMLTPLVIYLLVANLVKTRIMHLCTSALIFFIIILSMSPQINGTRGYSRSADYLNVVLPDSIKNISEATVLIAYPTYALDADPRPAQFLIGFLPEHWRFIGIPFYHRLYDNTDKNSEIKTHHLIDNYNGKFYLLASSSAISELYKTAIVFNLIPSGRCDVIKNDRSTAIEEETLICPVSKIS